MAVLSVLSIALHALTCILHVQGWRGALRSGRFSVVAKETCSRTVATKFLQQHPFRHHTTLKANKVVDAKEFSSIYLFPNCPASFETVVGFIQAWSREYAELGSAFTMKPNKLGVDLVFSSAPDACLSIYAFLHKDQQLSGVGDIEIKQCLTLPSLSLKLQQLIQFTANSMVDSFVNEVGMLLTQAPSDSDNKEGNIIELDESEVDMDYIEANAKDFKEYMTKEVAKMVEVRDLVPQQQGDEVTVEKKTGTERITAKKEEQKIIKEKPIKDSQKYYEVLASYPAVVSTERVLAVLEVFMLQYNKAAIGVHVNELPEERLKESSKLRPEEQEGEVLAGIEVDFSLPDGIKYEVKAYKVAGGGVEVRGKIRSPANSENILDEVSGMPDIAKKIVSDLKQSFKGLKALPPLSPDQLPSPKSQFIPQLGEDELDMDVPPSIHDQQLFTKLPDPPSAATIAKTSTRPSATTPPTPSTPLSSSKRDPLLTSRAERLSLNLDKFEKKGIEEAAASELQQLLNSQKKKGFMTVLQDYASPLSSEDKSAILPPIEDAHTPLILSPSASQSKSSKPSAAEISSSLSVSKETDPVRLRELQELFNRGRDVSQLQLTSLLERGDPLSGVDGDLIRKELQNLADRLNHTSVEDMFETDEAWNEEDSSSLPLLNPMQSNNKLDPELFLLENNRFNMLFTELRRAPDEVIPFVLDGFRDLLLSNSLIPIMRSKARDYTNLSDRRLFKLIIEKATSLYEEYYRIAQEQSKEFMEIINEICGVAYKYQGWNDKKFMQEIEEIKPAFSIPFLSYLNYLMRTVEEDVKKEGKDLAELLKSGSLLASSEKQKVTLGGNQYDQVEWYKILRIVHQAVLAEYIKRYETIIETILLLMRLQDLPEVQEDMFIRTMDKMNALDLPYFYTLCQNIIEKVNAFIGRYEDFELTSEGNFRDDDISKMSLDDQEIARSFNNDDKFYIKVASLKSLVSEYLTPEYIDQRMSEYETEIGEAGQEVVYRHRNAYIQKQIEKMERGREEAGMRSDIGVLRSEEEDEGEEEEDDEEEEVWRIIGEEDEVEGEVKSRSKKEAKKLEDIYRLPRYVNTRDNEININN